MGFGTTEISDSHIFVQLSNTVVLKTDISEVITFLLHEQNFCSKNAAKVRVASERMK